MSLLISHRPATQPGELDPNRLIVLQRRMSEQSGAAVMEVKASHAFISQLKAVAQVIESAARGALTAKK